MSNRSTSLRSCHLQGLGSGLIDARLIKLRENDLIDCMSDYIKRK